MWRASRTPAEWLNQLWNARGSAEPLVVPPASELDPALIDTLQSLYVHDDARLPDPHFLDQLEQTLMATAAITTLIATPPQQPNGRVASTPPPALLATRPLPAPRSHEWMPAQLATAALVLLTLVGSFVAFGGPLRPRSARGSSGRRSSHCRHSSGQSPAGPHRRHHPLPATDR